MPEPDEHPIWRFYERLYYAELRERRFAHNRTDTAITVFIALTGGAVVVWRNLPPSAETSRLLLLAAGVALAVALVAIASAWWATYYSFVSQPGKIEKWRQEAVAHFGSSADDTDADEESHSEVDDSGRRRVYDLFREEISSQLVDVVDSNRKRNKTQGALLAAGQAALLAAFLALGSAFIVGQNRDGGSPSVPRAVDSRNMPSAQGGDHVRHP